VTFDGNKEDRKDAIILHSLWDSVLILEQIYSWGTMVSDIENSLVPGLNAKLVSANGTDVLPNVPSPSERRGREPQIIGTTAAENNCLAISGHGPARSTVAILTESPSRL